MSHDAQDDMRGKFPSLGPCSTPGRGLAGDSLGDGEVEPSELAAVQLNGGSVTSTSGIHVAILLLSHPIRPAASAPLRMVSDDATA